MTKLNQEGAKLVADLSHARLAIYEAPRRAHEQDTKLEQILALERKLHGAEDASADQESRIKQLSRQWEAANANCEHMAAEGTSLK